MGSERLTSGYYFLLIFSVMAAQETLTLLVVVQIHEDQPFFAPVV